MTAFSSTRKVVGHACSSRIDAALVCQAMQRAFRRQAPDQGLIFHSDRGTQYASRRYPFLLDSNKMLF
ncbi:MAG: transposase family protein [Selenomonadaceae bacterium]|nr:transposase family protein [Selenomonadaceae bacterium]